LSAPLVWIDCRGPCRFAGEDYTHPAREAHFEIFIVAIDFSDAVADSGTSYSIVEITGKS